jgi:FAD/FMN-containing dehydrogenase
MPFHLPSWTLGPWSVRAFNEVLFRGWSLRRKLVDPEAFFFPLDRILHWNRLYGRSGMTQFQCVLPEKEAPGSTRRFLEVLSSAGGASPLCVIKDCGEEGEGRLSFPRPGVSVAVDLPVRRDTQEVIDRLSRATIDAGGRIYLAKDGWVKREHFRTMEPRLGAFLEAKRAVDPEGRLRSAQFERLMEEKE